MSGAVPLRPPHFPSRHMNRQNYFTFQCNLDAFSREHCYRVYYKGNFCAARGIALPPLGLFDLLIDYQRP